MINDNDNKHKQNERIYWDVNEIARKGKFIMNKKILCIENHKNEKN